MNIQSFLIAVRGYIFVWVENALFLQAVCTLVSAPILYGWKMPYAKFSPIGNLIFAPFMGAFIFLSAIIFLFSLINLFPWPIIKGFEKFIDLWTMFLRCGRTGWLTIPGKIVMSIWGVGALGLCLLIYYRTTIARIRQALIIWLLIFTNMLMLQNFFYLKPYKKAFLSKGKGTIIAIQDYQGVRLTDSGLFGRTQAVDKFIIFNLRPFLLQNFGHTKIKALTLKSFSARAMQAIVWCSKFFKIQEINLPKNWKRALFYEQNKISIDKTMLQISQGGTKIN